MKRELHGGVLVVGSLLWDEGAERARWRRDWLSVEHSIQVAAPIRYGRLSRSRGCTYTMVFSRLCLRRAYAGGMAVAVPLKRTVADANALVSAAHALWGAEAKSTNENKRVAASWGAIGLLLNPERPSTDHLLDPWRHEVQRQPAYRAPTHLRSEGPVVDAVSGRLLIPWPRTASGQPLELDFLLATATDPKLVVPGQRYPSAAQIAGAWIADQNGEVEYFRRNREHGICTFQDGRIRQHLLTAGIKSV